MKKNLFFKQSFIALLLLFIQQQVIAQITPKTIDYGAPKVVNFTELANQEINNPQRLQKRAVEQGEDKRNFKFHPKPLPKNATIWELNVPELKTEAPVDNSPAPSNNFIGIVDNETIIPPDTRGATGKTYILETTNQEFKIFTKTGAPVITLSLSSVFGSSGGTDFFDPHVLYDPNNDRYIIVVDGTLSTGHMGFFIAVSHTGDPRGLWYVYGFDAQTVNPSPSIDFFDYPQIGFNNNWVVVTGIDFLPSTYQIEIFAMNRAGLYSGAAGTATKFVDPNGVLYSPALTYDATQPTEYLVGDWNGNPGGGSGYVRLATITGTSTAPLYTVGAFLAINQPWNDQPVNAKQKGSTLLIEDGDTRIQGCTYRNGSLWFTHNIFLPASGTPNRSGVDWWQVNPSAATVTQFGRLQDSTANTFYYYPRLDVNTTNDMLLGFALSGTNNFASGAYALRRSTDPVNTLQSTYIYKSGVASYFKEYGGGRNRWGDFSGTAADPVDNTFWTFQEWANTGNNWATQIAHVPLATFVCNKPTGLTTSSITTTSAKLKWAAVTGAVSYKVQYRVLGSSTWSVKTTVPDSVVLTGLTTGTNYEWEVQSVCSSTSSSAFTTSVKFTTKGGCPPPITLKADSITTTTARLSWSAIAGVKSYNLQYKLKTDTIYKTITNILTNIYKLSGLNAGSNYVFRVQPVCSTATGIYSLLASFSTLYCASKGNSTKEYIKTVVLGSINHTSTNDGGYGNFTTLNTSLTAGSTYTIKLTPGFTDSVHNEFWSVYIDYNQNGVLNNSGERVVAVNGTGLVSKAFTVPLTAKNGATRLRIQMHRNTFITNPCVALDFGDVHDYKVTITGGTEPVINPLITSVDASTESSSGTINIIPNPVSSSNATAIYDLVNEGPVAIKMVDLNGNVVNKFDLGVQGEGRHNYLLRNLGKLSSAYYIIVLEQNEQIVGRTRMMVSH
jgi:hypothetical protein